MNGCEKLINRIKVYGRKNRLFLCLFALFCILSVAALIFISNNYEFYDDTIAKIVAITESEDHVEFSVDGECSETFYLQLIDAVILNGEKKDERISLENIRSESNVYDTYYREGDRIFVGENDGVWVIDGVKRDTWVATILFLFAAVLIIIGRKKGICSFVSLIVNVALLWIGLNVYLQGVNLLLVCSVCAMTLTLICLLLIGGFKRMTLMAVLSTISGTAVTFAVASAVIYGFDFSGLYVEGLEFLVIANDYRITFMSQILIGGLGAIMDIAVSVSSAMCELRYRDPYITRRALLRSGREIGRDITGTMANVLFFTYLCGTLPLMVVIVSNGVQLFKYIFANCNLEIARFLVGGIGIVLTVPISCYVSVFLVGKPREAGEKR